MNEQQIECKEIIYDLTQLRGRYTEKIDHLIRLYQRKIEQLKSDLAHLQHVAQCYSSSFDKITSLLDIQHRVVIPSTSEEEFQAFEDDLRGVETKLAALKSKKVTEKVVTVQKIVEIEKIVEVGVEVEVQKIVEVPVEREVIVEAQTEKIVEIDRPVFVEKLVEVEKLVPVEKIIEKEVPVYITREVEVECPRCRANGY